jgi:selenocysteine-specific elongation factor
VFVVGTAGHVDHGKTALIAALTGMDADRLPEEKARGMTTDLGFAYFEAPDGDCVGVVDVPGHERFLRNMAAGAWGLDLALLVVAADDGWMAQSRTHARILASLSAPKVILVVTKIDAVEPGHAESVALEAQDRAQALFGFRPEARLVSSLTGEGVEELKASIVASLFPDSRQFSGKPYLFVDRVFSLAGTGTVAAGILRGGPLSLKDELVLWPSGERVRVRSLESYKTGIERAMPVSRVALAVPKPRADLRRGDLLAAPDLKVLSDREFLGRLELLPGEANLIPQDERGRPLLRAGMEAELVLGSAHRDALVSPYRTPGYIRLVCDDPLACPEGQRFVLLRRGGTELLARGRILAAGVTDIKARRLMDSALAGVDALAASLADAQERRSDDNAPALPYRHALDIRTRGWTDLPPDGPPRESISALPGLVTAAGEGSLFAFAADSYAGFRRRTLELASKPGGAARAELESSLGLPARVCGALLGRLEDEKSLERSGTRWKKPGPPRPLGKEEAGLEALLVRAGKEGVEPGKNVPARDGRALKALCALGRAVALDNGIYLHKPVYEALAEAVLARRRTGESFTVGEAKERSGLSRKYALPLLNRMENDGLVRRQGDVRVVLDKGCRASC